MPTDPLPLLADLIRIPSVNPMGTGRTGPDYLEGRLAEHLAGLFARHNIRHERIELAPRRENVIARIDRPQARTTILLDAHQDTVPTEGMAIDPFDPQQRGGRLYGRGACDVKGPMAAMLAALLDLADDPSLSANIIFSATCDEESGQLGMSELVRCLDAEDNRSSLLAEPPDFAIVTEPTDLNIVVAHRGVVRWALRTRGRACHSSRPQEGLNAINRMGHVLTCLEEYAAGLGELTSPHPLCGPACMSVGRISGGTSINIVPDSCTIEIDRRTIPGERAERVIGHLAGVLDERLDFDVDMEPPMVALPLSDELNGPWSEKLMETITQVIGLRERVGALYGTHAPALAAAGIPTVVFGPGSIFQAHTEDEWISIEQMRQASEIYRRFCRSVGR